jgi:hypothetical protein
MEQEGDRQQQEQIVITRPQPEKPQKQKREVTEKQRQHLEKMRQIKAVRKEATKLVQKESKEPIIEPRNNGDSSLFLLLVGVGVVGIGGMFYMQQHKQKLTTTPMSQPSFQVLPMQHLPSQEQSPEPKKEQNKYSQLQLAF